MSRRGVLVWMLATAVGCGTVIAAQQDNKGLINPKGRQLLEGDQFQSPPTPPPDSFRNLMKANDGVMSVDATAVGGDAAAAGPGGAQTTFRGTLSGHLGTTPDFDAALKDAATLKANFAQIEAFFTTTVKSPDATEYTKAGARFLLELEAALKAKDRVKAINAQIGVAKACRECHINHRILVITQPLQFSILR